MAKMKAAIFIKPGRIALDEKSIPDIGPLDALMRMTTTTIFSRASIRWRGV
jgi:alcohol dehydrogenase